MAVSALRAAPATELATGPVLIGFAESLAAPETAWSLLEAGHDVVAFTRRGARPPLGRRRDVTLVEITAPEDDARRAADDVAAAAAAAGASAVMPLDDASVWLCDAAGADAAVLGPTGPQARLALDKRLQLDAAAQAGLLVPPTRRFAAPADALVLDEFPVVLKPALAAIERDGRLERDSGRICADRDELEQAVAAFAGDEPLLAQPVLRGVGHGVFGLAGPRGVEAWSAHRRVRMMNPQGSGSSACETAPVDDLLRASIERLVAETGWRGLFMVELLRDADGRAWFLELNGRAWGSMALSLRAGLDYPAWALRQARDPSFRAPQPPLPDPALLCRHLGRELVHLLFVLRGPRSRALEWPSRGRTLLDVLRVRRGDRWYNLRPGTRRLFLQDAIGTVAGQVRGR